MLLRFFFNSAKIMALLLSCAIPAFAAYELPETLWVKVTFYDFHADGTNPNFENCNCGRTIDMVQPYLDSIRKPVLLADLCCNDRLAEWYRPSGGTGATYGYDEATRSWRWTNLQPYKGRVGEYTGIGYDSTYDMANIVIYDSLPFTIYDPVTGTYEFVRTKNLNNHEQFFWLDGRGYGEEPAGKGHNYSFSMELHHEFTYRGGEFFNFRGDDDAWAFINGKRVIDLGGMQSEVQGAVDLDSRAAELGLVKGRKYFFDFFYNERRTTQSNIIITTNILTPAKPEHLIITTDQNPPVGPIDSIGKSGDTTISAGDCITWFAHVMDDTGAFRPEWSKNVLWSVRDSLGNPIDYLAKSDTNSFCLTKAYGCITVYLSFQDTLFPDVILYDTIEICVKPGAAHHLVVEASPDSSVSLRSDNPLHTLTFSSTETQHSVYAVLRDRFGNYTGPAIGSSWESTDPLIATARPGIPGMAEGVIERVAISGLTRAVAALGAFHDTLDVILSDITYDSLRIVAGANLLDIDTLRIRTDQDTTLLALGLRSDNKQWDNVYVRWTSSGISFQSPAPPWNDSWDDAGPLTAGIGRIAIAIPSGSGFKTDTLLVIASNGLPQSLILYPSEGRPDSGTNTRYPPPQLAVNAPAGITVPAVAKLFDSRGVWLQSYEIPYSPVSWRPTELSGMPPSGTLTSQSGFKTGFLPLRAGNQVFVIAEFRENGLALADTIRLTIRAGLPHHLVIESTPDRNASPYADNPLPRIFFTSSDTSANAYAILRDQYGNFIGASQRTTWRSIDSLIVAAQAGQTQLGEGLFFRRTTSGQTTIIAQSEDDTLLADTIIAELSNITYDSLRLVVNHNGLRDITVLTMRTDQDTTLIALGLRSDTRQWENIRAYWTSPGLRASPSASGQAFSWTFSPDTAGSGLIIITYGLRSDTVTAQFLPSLPARLELYRADGPPATVSGNTPYPPIPLFETIKAGDAPVVVAKLFGAAGEWLSSYENALAPIVWTIQEHVANTDIPTGSLSLTTGHTTSFSATKAYNTTDLVATFTDGSNVLRDTVRFQVQPGTPNHLVIESSPDWKISPHRDNPVDTIYIGSADTVATAYALLRDTFGNFAGYSQNAQWNTLTPATVAASPGVAQIGEGRLFRLATAGNGLVYALDVSGLADTVAVVISTVRYDSLRIVTPDAQSIASLMLSIGNDTTLWVQGRRADNGMWEYVRGDWQISGNLSVSPAAPRQVESWAFTPSDTGRGIIIAAMSSAAGRVADTIPVIFGSGNAAQLVLYPSQGAPGFSNQPYPSPGTSVTARAGTSVPFVAKLFDQYGVWLSSFENSTVPIVWSIIEQPGMSASGILSDSGGSLNSFLPIRAYRIVSIIAAYSLGSEIVSDTVEMVIQPGPAHHLVMEANQNRQVSPNSDNPIGTVTFTSIETYRRVYAIIRDSLGNWVNYSVLTDWDSRDSSVVRADAGIEGIGEGVITRIDTGTTFVVARNSELHYASLDLRDSVRIVVSNIYYRALRIVNVSETVLNELTMTTNDDTTLFVEGQRSDDTMWERIQSGWEVSSVLEDNITPPQSDDSWAFSPVAPGSGWIRVTLGVDSITRPDTLPVVFTRGSPVSARLDILTPPNQRIAGDTLVAIVGIFNLDGPVPGRYCFSQDSGTAGAIYSDPLQKPDSSQPDPNVIVNGSDMPILPAPDTTRRLSSQCIENGFDTIRFVVYYAPADPDSLHQLTAQLNGLKASSNPFALLAARVDSLVLEQPDSSAPKDSVVLRHPDGAAVLIAIGYDRFGNRRGPESADWSVDGTLHAIRHPDGVTRIYYQAADATDSESGVITAVAARADSTIRASIHVTIRGPLIALREAVTRDQNGNGYLDAIEMHFKKPFSLSIATHFPDIAIIYLRDTLLVDSIRSIHSSNDSLWIVFLKEDTSSGRSQTRWRPLISFSEFDSVAGAANVVCTDGAGPVVWSVIKTIEDTDKRSADRIRIVLSEPVQGVDGNALKVSTSPALIFSAWYIDESGQYAELPGMFGGIANLQEIVRDSIIEFYMTNGKDLSGSHFVNLTIDTVAIVDKASVPNAAIAENRRVRVTVIAPPPPTEVVPFPNPSRPTFAHVASGQFSAEHQPQARRWVAIDRAGSVLSFKMNIPTEGSATLLVKIYDAVGNLVVMSKNADLLRNLPRGVAAHDIDIYWNGSNQQGMKVAPGVYRVAMYVDYANNKNRDLKILGAVGIGK